MRQTDRELGIFARLALDRDRAAVLLGDDVVADRQTQPRTLAGRLRREEGLEQSVLDLGRDADAVIVHPHLDGPAEVARRHLQGRPEVWTGTVALPLRRGVEAIP